MNHKVQLTDNSSAVGDLKLYLGFIYDSLSNPDSTIQNLLQIIAKQSSTYQLRKF